MLFSIFLSSKRSFFFAFISILLSRLICFEEVNIALKIYLSFSGIPPFIIFFASSSLTSSPLPVSLFLLHHHHYLLLFLVLVLLLHLLRHSYSSNAAAPSTILRKKGCFLQYFMALPYISSSSFFLMYSPILFYVLSYLHPSSISCSIPGVQFSLIYVHHALPPSQGRNYGDFGKFRRIHNSLLTR